VVVVVGSERSAGTTTLAVAMATRFAVTGSQVLLIDADVRHPAITGAFARGRPGIAALASLALSDRSALRQAGSIDPFAPTSVPGLSVVGLGPKSTTAPLRRQNVLDVVVAAKAHSPVVVFDGGPLLGSATTVHLAQLADAVVLAVPLARQRLDELASVTRQTSLLEGEVIVVDMPALRPRRVSEHRRGKLPTAEISPPTTTGPGPLAPPVPAKIGGEYMNGPTATQLVDDEGQVPTSSSDEGASR
jgi:Mrp family chromosome partitioning ATPase